MSKFFVFKSLLLSCLQTKGNRVDSSNCHSNDPLPLTTLLVDTQLIEERRDTRKRKASGQGGAVRRGPAPVEVKTTLEPALFDIDLTVNKVN